MKVKMEDEKGNDIYNPEKEQAGGTAQDAKVLNSLGGIFLLFGGLSFVFLKFCLLCH